jgi:hypothetical protein
MAGSRFCVVDENYMPVVTEEMSPISTLAWNVILLSSLIKRMTQPMALDEYFNLSTFRRPFMAIDAYLQIDGIKGESQDCD